MPLSSERSAESSASKSVQDKCHSKSLKERKCKTETSHGMSSMSTVTLLEKTEKEQTSSNKYEKKKSFPSARNNPPELIHYLKDRHSSKIKDNHNNPPQLLPEVIVTRTKLNKERPQASEMSTCKKKIGKFDDVKYPPTVMEPDDSKLQEYNVNTKIAIKNLQKLKKRSGQKAHISNQISSELLPNATQKQNVKINKVAEGPQESIVEQQRKIILDLQEKQKKSRQWNLREKMKKAGEKLLHFPVLNINTDKCCDIGLKNVDENSKEKVQISNFLQDSAVSEFLTRDCNIVVSRGRPVPDKRPSSPLMETRLESESSSDIVEMNTVLDCDEWMEEEDEEDMYVTPQRVSTGKEERDTVDGMEFLSFETEHDMVEFTKIELDFQGVSLHDDGMVQSDDGLDMMDDSLAYSESETCNVSQAIIPTKTKDITKIKGWRTKQFAVNNNPTLAHCSSSNGPYEDDDGFGSCDIKIKEETSPNMIEDQMEEWYSDDDFYGFADTSSLKDFNKVMEGSLNKNIVSPTKEDAVLYSCTVSHPNDMELLKCYEATIEQVEEIVDEVNHTDDIASSNEESVNNEVYRGSNLYPGIVFPIPDPVPLKVLKKRGRKPKTLAEKRILLELDKINQKLRRKDTFRSQRHKLRSAKAKKITKTTVPSKTYTSVSVDKKSSSNVDYLTSSDQEYCPPTNKKDYTLDHSYKYIWDQGRPIRLSGSQKNIQLNCENISSKDDSPLSTDTSDIINVPDIISVPEKGVTNVISDNIDADVVAKSDPVLERLSENPETEDCDVSKSFNNNLCLVVNPGIGKQLVPLAIEQLDLLRADSYDIDSTWANFATSVVLSRDWRKNPLPRHRIEIPILCSQLSKSTVDYLSAQNFLKRNGNVSPSGQPSMPMVPTGLRLLQPSFPTFPSNSNHVMPRFGPMGCSSVRVRCPKPASQIGVRTIPSLVKSNPIIVSNSPKLSDISACSLTESNTINSIGKETVTKKYLSVAPVKCVGSHKYQSDSFNSSVSLSDIDMNTAVKGVVDGIVNYVVHSEVKDSIIHNDPDVIDHVPSIISTSPKKDMDKRRRGIFRELSRLNVKVIEMDTHQQDFTSGKFNQINTPRCFQEMCRFGCVCGSLLMCKPPAHEHCGKVQCMFECKCDFQSDTSGISQNETTDIKISPFSEGTVLRLQNEAVRNLAKEEKEFQHTVFSSKDEMIVVGGDGNVRRKREIKLPERYRDSYVELSKTEAKTVPEETVETSRRPGIFQTLFLGSNEPPKIITAPSKITWEEMEVTKKQEYNIVESHVVMYKMNNLQDVEPLCMEHCKYKCNCSGFLKKGPYVGIRREMLGTNSQCEVPRKIQGKRHSLFETHDKLTCLQPPAKKSRNIAVKSTTSEPYGHGHDVYRHSARTSAPGISYLLRNKSHYFRRIQHQAFSKLQKTQVVSIENKHDSDSPIYEHDDENDELDMTSIEFTISQESNSKLAVSLENEYNHHQEFSKPQKSQLISFESNLHSNKHVSAHCEVEQSHEETDGLEASSVESTISQECNSKLNPKLNILLAGEDCKIDVKDPPETIGKIENITSLSQEEFQQVESPISLNTEQHLAKKKLQDCTSPNLTAAISLKSPYGILHHKLKMTSISIAKLLKRLKKKNRTIKGWGHTSSPSTVGDSFHLLKWNALSKQFLNDNIQLWYRKGNMNHEGWRLLITASRTRPDAAFINVNEISLSNCGALPQIVSDILKLSTPACTEAEKMVDYPEEESYVVLYFDGKNWGIVARFDNRNKISTDSMLSNYSITALTEKNSCTVIGLDNFQGDCSSSNTAQSPSVSLPSEKAVVSFKDMPEIDNWPSVEQVQSDIISNTTCTEQPALVLHTTDKELVSFPDVTNCNEKHRSVALSESKSTCEKENKENFPISKTKYKNILNEHESLVVVSNTSSDTGSNEHKFLSCSDTSSTTVVREEQVTTNDITLHEPPQTRSLSAEVGTQEIGSDSVSNNSKDTLLPSHTSPELKVLDEKSIETCSEKQVQSSSEIGTGSTDVKDVTIERISDLKIGNKECSKNSIIETPSVTVQKCKEATITLNSVTESCSTNIQISLPICSTDARWFVLRMDKTFELMYVTSRKCSVSYVRMIEAILMANKHKKTVRLPLQRPNDNIGTEGSGSQPKFGVYAIPALVTRIFVGPYNLQEDACIVIYKDGKFVNVLDLENDETNPIITPESLSELIKKKPSSGSFENMYKFYTEVQASSKKGSIYNKRMWHYTLGTLGMSENCKNNENCNTEVKKIETTFSENVTEDTSSTDEMCISSRKERSRRKQVLEVRQFLPLQKQHLEKVMQEFKDSENPNHSVDNTSSRDLDNDGKSLSVHSIVNITHEDTSDSEELDVETTSDGLNKVQENVKEDTAILIAQGSCDRTVHEFDSQNIQAIHKFSLRKRRVIKKRMNIPSKLRYLLPLPELQARRSCVPVKLVPSIPSIGFICATYTSDGKISFAHPFTCAQVQFPTLGAANQWLHRFLQSRIRYIPKQITVYWKIVPNSYEDLTAKPFNSCILNGNRILTLKGIFDLNVMVADQAAVYGLRAADVIRLQDKRHRRDLMEGFNKLGKLLRQNENWEIKSKYDILVKAKEEILNLQAISTTQTTEETALINLRTDRFHKLYTLMKELYPLDDTFITRMRKVRSEIHDVPVIDLDKETESSNCSIIAQIGSEKSWKLETVIDITCSESDIEDYLTEDDSPIEEKECSKLNIDRLDNRLNVPDKTSINNDHKPPLNSQNKLDDTSVSIYVVSEKNTPETSEKLVSNEADVTVTCIPTTKTFKMMCDVVQSKPVCLVKQDSITISSSYIPNNSVNECKLTSSISDGNVLSNISSVPQNGIAVCSDTDKLNCVVTNTINPALQISFVKPIPRAIKRKCSEYTESDDVIFVDGFENIKKVNDNSSEINAQRIQSSSPLAAQSPTGISAISIGSCTTPTEDPINASTSLKQNVIEKKKIDRNYFKTDITKIKIFGGPIIGRRLEEKAKQDRMNISIPVGNYDVQKKTMKNISYVKVLSPPVCVTTSLQEGNTSLQGENLNVLPCATNPSQETYTSLKEGKCFSVLPSPECLKMSTQNCISPSASIATSSKEVQSLKLVSLKVLPTSTSSQELKGITTSACATNSLREIKSLKVLPCVTTSSLEVKNVKLLPCVTSSPQKVNNLKVIPTSTSVTIPSQEAKSLREAKTLKVLPTSTCVTTSSQEVKNVKVIPCVTTSSQEINSFKVLPLSTCVTNSLQEVKSLKVLPLSTCATTTSQEIKCLKVLPFSSCVTTLSQGSKSIRYLDTLVKAKNTSTQVYKSSITSPTTKSANILRNGQTDSTNQISETKPSHGVQANQGYKYVLQNNGRNIIVSGSSHSVSLLLRKSPNSSTAVPKLNPGVISCVCSASGKSNNQSAVFTKSGGKSGTSTSNIYQLKQVYRSAISHTVQRDSSTSNAGPSASATVHADVSQTVVPALIPIIDGKAVLPMTFGNCISSALKHTQTNSNPNLNPVPTSTSLNTSGENVSVERTVPALLNKKPSLIVCKKPAHS